MYEKTTTIVNKTGLHARPASVFVAATKGYSSKITIKNLKTGKQADAKSILMLLTLALSKGTEVSLSAVGEDEVKAVDELVALIESGFGEE